MKINFNFLLLISISVLISCKSDYDKLVQSEIKKDVKHTDLILDMKMGQNKDYFFKHCWNLNKAQIVSQGPGNKYAKYYMLPDSSLMEEGKKIRVLFYGMFDENDVMNGMEMKMEYNAWSPWNKSYSSDSLLEEMKSKYIREYKGNDYYVVNVNDDLDAFAKIDGNRQVLLYKLTEKEIMVKIQDLTDHYKSLIED